MQQTASETCEPASARRAPASRLRAAQEAGLSDEAVTALIAVARHDMRRERV
jgi:hypothetical protein